MGNFSRHTFNVLKRYTAVRLQQGVPLVDADWNEKDEIRRFELRAFLKWFVGNGVPETKDAFRIVAKEPPEPDNFTISAGNGSGEDPGVDPYQTGFSSGRCLVEGLDVFIIQDIEFKEQPLHVEYEGPEVVVDPNAPPIQSIPDSVEPVIAYLDVWEWEVGEESDPDIVDDRIEIETSVRLKRDWAVRVRFGTSVPVPGDDDYVGDDPDEPEHSYYALAEISHGSGSPIAEADISDLRQTRLTLANVEQRLRNLEPLSSTVPELQGRLAEAENRLNQLEELLLTPSFAPSPNQFTPKFGPTGTEVTLFGNNFNIGDPTVRFDTVEAEIVGTPTATQIVARVPSMPDGDITITVETSFGTAVSDDEFTILPAPALPTFNPSPNQFTPKFGPTGTDVELFGNNLRVGTTTVSFGTTAAQIVSETNGIIVRVPLMSPTSVPITVETSVGSVTSDDTFTIL